MYIVLRHELFQGLSQMPFAAFLVRPCQARSSCCCVCYSIVCIRKHAKQPSSQCISSKQASPCRLAHILKLLCLLHEQLFYSSLVVPLPCVVMSHMNCIVGVLIGVSCTHQLCCDWRVLQQCYSSVSCVGLPVGLEAPGLTPNGVILLFLSVLLTSKICCCQQFAGKLQ